MPSDTRRLLLNSVVIKSVDRVAVESAVESYVARLRVQHPEVKRVFWFGSWITGLPSPGSDVDLCLVLSSSDKNRRDRMPDYLPVGFPVGIDLVAYTQAEFQQLQEDSPGWHAVLLSGREL